VPGSKLSPAKTSPISGDSVVINVTTVAFLAAARRHFMNTKLVQQARLTGLQAFDAAESVSANIV
jgi:hypothetical protein